MLPFFPKIYRTLKNPIAFGKVLQNLPFTEFKKILFDVKSLFTNFSKSGDPIVLNRLREFHYSHFENQVLLYLSRTCLSQTTYSSQCSYTKNMTAHPYVPLVDFRRHLHALF